MTLVLVLALVFLVVGSVLGVLQKRLRASLPINPASSAPPGAPPPEPRRDGALDGASGKISFAARQYRGEMSGIATQRMVTVPPAGAFFLASGLDGLAMPGLAACLVADGLRDALEAAAAQRPSDLAPERRLAFLRAEVEAANGRVAAFNAKHAPGATPDAAERVGGSVLAAIVAVDRVLVAHVGAHRAYRVHHGRAEQLTEDHSMISEVIRAKGLTGAEARDAWATLPRSFRNMLVRVLGMKNTVVVDVAEHAFLPGDRLVLVTGSVGDFVGDAPLEALLARSGDAATLADAVMVAAIGAHPARDHAVVVVAAQ